MCRSRAVISLLLLLSFFSPLSAVDGSYLVTIPVSELTNWKAELSIMKQNLRNMEIDKDELLTLSAGQQEQIVNLLAKSKALENRINDLLKESEISAEQFQKISDDFQTLKKEFNIISARVKKLETQNKIILGSGIVATIAAFVGGLILGIKLDK